MAAGKDVSKGEEKKELDYSKLCTRDIRPLLWIVTVGGLLLALLAILRGYLGSLPWIGAMVGLPWTAYGTICSFYLNMAKSDHSAGGITFEAAKMNGFKLEPTVQDPVQNPVQGTDDWQSPQI